MTLRTLTVPCALVALFLLAAPPAGAQPASQARQAQLRVKMPERDADLTIDGKPTKQGGAERWFITPPLEPGAAYTYTLTACWEPNGYTTMYRSRKVAVRAGEEVEVDLRLPDPRRPDEIRIHFVPTPDEV